MFLLLPFTIWMFDASLTSEVSYEQFASVFSFGAAGLPGWFFKLVALALIWAYLLHFIGGLRHLWMDATHAVGLSFGRQSALVRHRPQHRRRARARLQAVLLRRARMST